jgi:glycosyltransferase involved in cell wall biosynthesis
MKFLRSYRARADRRRGDRARAAQNWSAAAAAYRRHLAKMPDDMPIWVQLGHMLAEAGDFSAAERAYRTANDLVPENADLLLCWGHLRKRSGDPEGAADLYARSVAVGAGPGADAERCFVGLAEAAHRGTATTRESPIHLPFAGKVEWTHGRTIAGFVASFDDEVPSGVEFRDGASIVGRAMPGHRREGGFAFKTLCDVRGDAEISAFRTSDGIELEGSPVRMWRDDRRDVGRPFAWTVRAEIVKQFGAPSSAELALFLTHSTTGALKPHVSPFLAALRANDIAVLLIVVTDRPVNISEATLNLVNGAIVRENAGWDFAGWAHAIHLHPEVYGASTLYLVNDSVLLSSDPERLRDMLIRVRASSADLVGLTESHEYRWHLQTYFMALKPRLLSSLPLHDLFANVRLLDDKDAVIREYELRFASMVKESGHRTETLFSSSVALNPTLHDWRGLLSDGFPFMKVLPLRGVFENVDLTGWREILTKAGFDLDLIDATVRASDEAVPHDGDRRLFAHSINRAPGPDRQLKVAFYGPWNYDNGLGAAARATIAAIRHTGCRLNLHPIRKSFHIHRPISPAVDIVDFEGPADIAVVHLNPDSWFLLTSDQRSAIHMACKRIGYWVWEMSHVPPAWRHDFSSVDRIWAPSRYCAKLFAAQDEAPVDIVPHAVPIMPELTFDRDAVRARIGAPILGRLILYIFDGSSYLVRKNPSALVRAFDASGLAASGWTLVLKTKHLLDRPDEGHALRSLVESVEGVLLIDLTLSSDELEQLLVTADIYASPHCSEGFGLTIAEAMAAGKPVVATDFGGSVDWLDESTGYPVRAHPWRLETDFGHYSKGGEWVRIDEPALTDALIRAAASVIAGDDRIGAAARAQIADRLSYKQVGQTISESFCALFQGRGGQPAVHRLSPSLLAGMPLERCDLSHWVHVEPLEADGTPIAGHTNVPEHVPTDRDHFIAFAPKGARMTPLFARIVEDAARDRPDVAIFYGDDLAVETEEPVDQLRLKPEFDVTLLTAQDYVGAPVIVRGSALHALGGLSVDMRTAATADLLFRALAKGMSIARIPEVLLAHPARRVRAAQTDYRAMLEAQPRHADCYIVTGPAPDTLMLRRRFDVRNMPAVTLIVPTRRSLITGEQGSYVERLLTGIAQVDWAMDRLTVLVGDDIAGAADWIEKDWPFLLRRVETPRAPGEPFNYAAKMNRLWRIAETEQIVFLNDDLQPLAPGWLRALQTFALDRGVGGVGARLLFDDGSLQHAGMAPHGLGAAHSWVFRTRVAGTYQDWARVQREWSMVTGAVFATRRSLMEHVGGFDEHFSLEFNDTDLCLRLRAMGYRIVCTPDAEMIHTEKASRGETLPPGDDIARFLSRWRQWLANDPSWHPQLARDRLNVTPLHDDHAWYL